MMLTPVVMRFTFSDFESLPSRPGDSTLSKESPSGCGTEWELELYPGGSDLLSRNGIYSNAIALYLQNISTKEIHGTMTITVRDSKGNAYLHHGGKFIRCFEREEGDDPVGYDNIVRRSEILDETNDILVDGALIVDVEIQEVNTANDTNKFQPSNSFANNMLKLLENEDGSDVSFKVGDSVIPAHKLILKMNAPMLFSFCDKHERGTSISIEDTKVNVFRHVLRYAYGGSEPDASEIRKFGKELLDASDRYGVVNLKMAVETTLVKLRVMNVENVVDWILFADAKTCPLLKEYALSYFAGRVKDVLAEDSSKKLKESPELLDEVMIAISNNPNNFIDEIGRMTINELRTKLDEKDLDVDGSKEMLVSRLNKSNKRQRTE